MSEIINGLKREIDQIAYKNLDEIKLSIVERHGKRLNVLVEIKYRDYDYPVGREDLESSIYKMDALSFIQKEISKVDLVGLKNINISTTLEIREILLKFEFVYFLDVEPLKIGTEVEFISNNEKFLGVVEEYCNDNPYKVEVRVGDYKVHIIDFRDLFPIYK
ncbi:hypothetical protein QPC10_002378 [Enterococcus faecium]|uniref:hypothetical protein n=1 Tax=Enterococcus faecium TaxID=1352 RepID=UPI000CF327C5|nr:hypothetical protein [Enterococcus faecium]EME3547204.1 hypothetical protein [Enterococcus faecium]PQG46366.1 hypothetical protein CUS80_05560 [Enterococcus faecium]